VLSGTRTDRPQYQAMLARVRELRAEGRSVVVVVAWLHRLGRRVLESVERREEFKALGVPIHSVMEGGAVDDLRANIMASVAQYEVQQLGERVSAAITHIMSNGWHRGSNPPWGYKLRPATEDERAAGAPKGVLEVDDAAAPYVREAFQRVADGESINAIARWAAALPANVRGARLDLPAEERGIRQHGKHLSYAAVRKILACPTYIARGHDGPDNALTRPVCRWPALVEDATWARVQERTASHQKVPRQASGRYLLTGLLYCPQCASRKFDARMNGEGEHRKNGAVAYAARYRCSGTQSARTQGAVCTFMVNMKQLDRAVLEEVASVMGALSRLEDRRFMAALRREWGELQAPAPADANIVRRVKQYEADITKATERIKALTIKLADGALDDVTYKATVKDIDRARAEAEKEVTRLRGVPVKTRTLPPLETVLERIGGWQEALAEFDVAHQREVLAELIERIEPIRTKRTATRGTPFAYEATIQWTPQGEGLYAMSGEAGAAAR